ncbi:SHOCT domain-containing protein [Arthrobacter sp. UYCo732]|uniref:SHOCT domain-containing protein n=1 Tax=Arthrobacter sp. UYCo732 TaxID=3156336 RepID=UPI003399DCBA
MFKPRVVLTVLGMVVAIAGTAGGFLLPVGPYCSGAFLAQKASLDAGARVGVTATLTACRANAEQYAPIWVAAIVAGLLLFTLTLVWTLVASGRSAAVAKQSRPVTAAVPAAQGGGSRSTPAWPWMLGIAIIGIGVFLGYTVDVGPYCDGAFATQNSAAGADIATAMSGKYSNYSDECRAAAAQQSVIYWGIIGFGAAVCVLGLVLRTVLRRPAGATRPGTIADELEQLAGLLERGVLTPDEFAQQKGKILSRG